MNARYGYAVMGRDPRAPDPPTNPTAKDRAYSAWQDVDAKVKALQAQVANDPRNPNLQGALFQLKTQADALWATYLAMPQGTGKGPMGKTPTESKRLWGELQAAEKRHADARTIFYMRQAYKAAVDREKAAGRTPFIPTGAGPLLGDSSVTGKDVLTVAVLTSPAWVPLLWSWLR